MAEGGDNLQESGNGSGDGVVGALKSKELLVPAALSAVGAVAVSKGPDLLKKLGNATEQKSGAKLAAKLIPGGGGDGKKTRRLPIQRWTDVAVPIATAYDEWTNFRQYPEFMHRVLN